MIMVKRKVANPVVAESDVNPITCPSIEGLEIDVLSMPGPDLPLEDMKDENKFVFKNPSFQYSIRTLNKKRTWRSLKQIIVQERSLPWGEDLLHYSTIDGPPSFNPAKKYSDISGLQAKYMDPQSKLNFASAEEFGTVRSLPMDITAGYLALRRANNPVG